MKTKTKLYKEKTPLLHLTRRNFFFIFLGWIVASLILVGMNQVRTSITYNRIFRYQEGDYVQEDFVITEDFIFTDEEATDKLIALNRSLANPVYIVSTEITESVLEHYDTFKNIYNNLILGDDVEPNRERLKQEFLGALNLIERSIPREPEVMNLLLKKTRDIIHDIHYTGIFLLDTSDNATTSGLIEVVYSGDAPENRVSMLVSSLIRPENITEHIRTLHSIQALEPFNREFVIALTAYFSEANAHISRFLTEENRKTAENNTIPVVVELNHGTKVLQAGDMISTRQKKILQKLSEQRGSNFKNLIHPFLFMTFIFAFGFVVIDNFNIKFAKRKTLWVYISLIALYIIIAAFLNAFARYPEFLNMGLILPTSLFILMITQLLQNKPLGILTAVLMGLFIFFLTSGSIDDFLITLAASMSAILAARKEEAGMGLLRAAPRLSAMMGIMSFLICIISNVALPTAMLMLAVAAGNGLLTGILAFALLPVLGHSLNLATSFRLVELSDPNTPILKRMRLQALGTYVHSQNVAQLAESACDAIEANGLLARVGSYYHDIGKVDQAQFFVENQVGENKHDDMKASLSATVIKAHVKMGIEKGREIRLPDEVLEVIEQHHGTSIIRYFYDRAVKEEGVDYASSNYFAYGGPKPQSREAAVVMLADSAEAATRTLKKPTIAKLEKFVWDIIITRFKDGELSECQLTIQDLDIIKNTFAHVLSGHFHQRIEYPKDNDE